MQTTYSVTSNDGPPLPLNCTIQPSLLLGFGVFVLQSMRPGKDATTPAPWPTFGDCTTSLASAPADDEAKVGTAEIITRPPKGQVPSGIDGRTTLPAQS